VQGGRLVYHHAAGQSPALYDSFQVRVRDEDPTHPASSGRVSIHLFRPASSELESAPDELAGILPGSAAALDPQLRAYLLSRDYGYIAWNLSGAIRPAGVAAPTTALSAEGYEIFVERYGPERLQVLSGGAAADVLSGGMAGDILSGGRGDDNLFGGGGADLFTWSHADEGHDSILDFSPAEGDVLVLSDLFSGVSGLVDHYLRLVLDGADAVIEVGLAGDGVDYGDLSIRLTGFADPDLSLRSLVSSGALQVGSLELMTRISIETLAGASENGPRSGMVRVRRDGSVDAPLAVNLVVSGAATNGVDFSLISETLIIPLGASHADILLAPFADALTEPLEIAEIWLADGAGYEIDPAAGSAQVAIEDLLPQLWLELVRQNGYLDTGLPALVLLRRENLAERSLFVRLRYSGTASLGAHFSAPEFVNLLPGQTSELLQIEPRIGAQLPGGVGSVVLEVVPDPAYKLAEPTWAEVVLAGNEDNFGLWAQRHFGGATGDLSSLAAQDPGGYGVTLFERYAYRLDPHNPLRDQPRLPAVSVGEDGKLHFEFYRSAGVRDLSFNMELSSDLETWQSGEALFERYLVPWQEDAPGRTAYRSILPVDAQDAIFVRIRTILLQP